MGLKDATPQTARFTSTTTANPAAFGFEPLSLGFTTDTLVVPTGPINRDRPPPPNLDSASLILLLLLPSKHQSYRQFPRKQEFSLQDRGRMHVPHLG